MFIAWLAIVALCLLATSPLERRGSMGAAMFSCLLGLLLLGVGLLLICSRLAINSGAQGRYLQAGIDMIPMAIGGLIVWLTARPFATLVSSWIRRK